MKKLFKRIVCSFLISTLALSGLPSMGMMDLKADEVDLKQTQVEQILKSSAKSYDLILYFQDVNGLNDSELGGTVSKSQKRAIALLDDAISRGLAKEYKVFEPINAISAVIYDEEIIRELANLEEVVELQENQVVDADFSTEPVELMSRSYLPEASEQIEWGVKAIHADKVWEEYGLTGAGVTVGIIDTGVNFRLPSLKNAFKGYDPNSDVYNSAYYYDFTTGSNELTNTGNDHGTHVAGIIVGKEGDGVKQTGVAPGAKFISAKAVSAERQYTNAMVVEAFLWLIEQNVDIINCSFGAPYSDSNTYLEKVIRLAESKNIAVVISSGNVKGKRTRGLLYPAATASGGIVVGSVDQNLKLSSFSARGPSLMNGMKGVIRPDLVAPGEWVRSTMYSGRLGIMNGTSQAAPHVSGVIALLKEAKPDITVDEIKSILKSSAQSLTDSEFRSSPNMGYGYGMVNAYDAVSTVMGRKMGSIYGSVVSGAPRIMSVYEEIAMMPSNAVKELPYTWREDVEVEDYYDLPPIDAKLITKNTKISLDFVDQEDMGYAYIAISKTGNEEYYPDELEFNNLDEQESGNSLVHREYSLADYVDDTAEYLYVRLYLQNFEDTLSRKLLLKSYSVYNEIADESALIASESVIETNAVLDLPISDTANPSNDSSAGPGKVLDTTAPTMNNETASFEAPQLTSEASGFDQNVSETTAVETQTLSETVVETSPIESQTVSLGASVLGGQTVSTEMSDARAGIASVATMQSVEETGLQNHLETVRGVELATASDAVAPNRVLTTSESGLKTESNQSYGDDRVIKSQSYGERNHSLSVDGSNTKKVESELDGAIEKSVATTRQEEITHDEIVGNNGIYNVGVTPQSIKYSPISMRNLNVNIPFRPMVKVLNSGKSVIVDDKGNYSLKHSVNAPDKPLLLEASAYGYETKVIEVDLNIEKDQQKNIVLYPAPIAKVEGRLLDDDGNPIEGAIVHILEDMLIENVRTSKEGFYRINAAYRGVYTIMFSKEGYLTKTMKVGLKAGENKLKDVRLYKLSNPVEVSITNGFDVSNDSRNRMEVLNYGDSLAGGAVKFTPPQKDSILKSANLYMISGDGYRGNEIVVGVLSEQDGKLVERIPFRGYKVNARGWVTFDLSSYYIYSKEPVYVVYLYNKSTSRSIGVGVQKNSTLEATNNSYLFDGDLHPFNRIRNFSGYGIAMTTDWLSGVLPPDAESMEENNDFDPNEFGPTYQYRIDDNTIEIDKAPDGHRSGNSGSYHSKEREFDDGGLEKPPSGETKKRQEEKKDQTAEEPKEQDIAEIDSLIHKNKGIISNVGQNRSREYTKEEREELLANGNKLIQNYVVPMDTVEGIWKLNPISGRWNLFVDGIRMDNRWVRVFVEKPNAQGVHHSWFHFDQDGAMEIGFYRSLDGYFYYLSENEGNSKGELALGWKKINGDYFYFRNDGSEIEGAMLTGWMKTAENKRYYLYPDGERLGKMATGWVVIQGKEYYFSEEEDTLGELKLLKKDEASKFKTKEQPLETLAKETLRNDIPLKEKLSSQVGTDGNLSNHVVIVGEAPGKSGETMKGYGVAPGHLNESPKRFDEQPNHIHETQKKYDDMVKMNHITSDVGQSILIGPSGETQNEGAWKPTEKEGLIYVDEVFPNSNFNSNVRNQKVDDDILVGPDGKRLDNQMTANEIEVPLSEGRGAFKQTVPFVGESKYQIEVENRVQEGRRAKGSNGNIQDSHNSIENAIIESNVVSNVKKTLQPDRSSFHPLIEEKNNVL